MLKRKMNERRAKDRADKAPFATPEPERAGELWTVQEDRELIGKVKNREALTQIAAHFRRTTGAVLARMEYIATVHQRLTNARKTLDAMDAAEWRAEELSTPKTEQPLSMFQETTAPEVATTLNVPRELVDVPPLRRATARHRFVGNTLSERCLVCSLVASDPVHES